jgi:hypothetical protein
MRSRKLASETPISWRGSAGRVGQRPEQVEHGPDSQLVAHGHDEARRLVVGGREHEAEAGLCDARRDGLRVEVDPRSKRLQQIRRARFARGRAIAVLGDRASSARCDQCRGGGHVERAAPSTGTRGVQQVLAVAEHVCGQSAHRAREARELFDRLTLRSQRDQERRDLGLGDVAVHDLGEHLRGLLHAQVPPRRERVDRACQGRIGHQLLRKLDSSSRPCSVSTDSGWN